MAVVPFSIHMQHNTSCRSQSLEPIWSYIKQQIWKAVSKGIGNLSKCVFLRDNEKHRENYWNKLKSDWVKGLHSHTLRVRSWHWRVTRRLSSQKSTGKVECEGWQKYKNDESCLAIAAGWHFHQWKVNCVMELRYIIASNYCYLLAQSEKTF